MTVPFSQETFTTGTANGVAITFNAGSHEWVESKYYVTLLHDYARKPPPGYPNAIAGQAISASYTAYPRTILSGTRIRLFHIEAQSLVNARAAVFS